MEQGHAQLINIFLMVGPLQDLEMNVSVSSSIPVNSLFTMSQTLRPLVRLWVSTLGLSLRRNGTESSIHFFPREFFTKPCIFYVELFGSPLLFQVNECIGWLCTLPPSISFKSKHKIESVPWCCQLQFGSCLGSRFIQWLLHHNLSLLRSETKYQQVYIT